MSLRRNQRKILVIEPIEFSVILVREIHIQRVVKVPVVITKNI